MYTNEGVHMAFAFADELRDYLKKNDPDKEGLRYTSIGSNHTYGVYVIFRLDERNVLGLTLDTMRLTLLDIPGMPEDEGIDVGRIFSNRSTCVSRIGELIKSTAELRHLNEALSWADSSLVYTEFTVRHAGPHKYVPVLTRGRSREESFHVIVQDGTMMLFNERHSIHGSLKQDDGGPAWSGYNLFEAVRDLIGPTL